MHHAYIVTGELTGERTLTLDESLPLPSTRVRLIVEPIGVEHQNSYTEVMAAIRRRQKARDYRPRTRDEVDATLQNERASWDD